MDDASPGGMIDVEDEIDEDLELEDEEAAEEDELGTAFSSAVGNDVPRSSTPLLQIDDGGADDGSNADPTCSGMVEVKMETMSPREDHTHRMLPQVTSTVINVAAECSRVVKDEEREDEEEGPAADLNEFEQEKSPQDGEDESLEELKEGDQQAPHHSDWSHEDFNLSKPRPRGRDYRASFWLDWCRSFGYLTQKAKDQKRTLVVSPSDIRNASSILIQSLEHADLFNDQLVVKVCTVTQEGLTLENVRNGERSFDFLMEMHVRRLLPPGFIYLALRSMLTGVRDCVFPSLRITVKEIVDVLDKMNELMEGPRSVEEWDRCMADPDVVPLIRRLAGKHFKAFRHYAKAFSALCPIAIPEFLSQYISTLGPFAAVGWSNAFGVTTGKNSIALSILAVEASEEGRVLAKLEWAHEFLKAGIMKQWEKDFYASFWSDWSRSYGIVDTIDRTEESIQQACNQIALSIDQVYRNELIKKMATVTSTSLCNVEDLSKSDSRTGHDFVVSLDHFGLVPRGFIYLVIRSVLSGTPPLAVLQLLSPCVEDTLNFIDDLHAQSKMITSTGQWELETGLREFLPLSSLLTDRLTAIYAHYPSHLVKLECQRMPPFIFPWLTSQSVGAAEKWSAAMCRELSPRALPISNRVPLGHPRHKKARRAKGVPNRILPASVPMARKMTPEEWRTAAWGPRPSLSHQQPPPIPHTLPTPPSTIAAPAKSSKGPLISTSPQDSKPNSARLPQQPNPHLMAPSAGTGRSNVWEGRPPAQVQAFAHVHFFVQWSESFGFSDGADFTKEEVNETARLCLQAMNNLYRGQLIGAIGKVQPDFKTFNAARYTQEGPASAGALMLLVALEWRLFFPRGYLYLLLRSAVLLRRQSGTSSLSSLVAPLEPLVDGTLYVLQSMLSILSHIASNKRGPKQWEENERNPRILASMNKITTDASNIMGQYPVLFGHLGCTRMPNFVLGWLRNQPEESAKEWAKKMCTHLDANGFPLCNRVSSTSFAHPSTPSRLPKAPQTSSKGATTTASPARVAPSITHLSVPVLQSLVVPQANPFGPTPVHSHPFSTSGGFNPAGYSQMGPPPGAICPPPSVLLNSSTASPAMGMYIHSMGPGMGRDPYGSMPSGAPPPWPGPPQPAIGATSLPVSHVPPQMAPMRVVDGLLSNDLRKKICNIIDTRHKKEDDDMDIDNEEDGEIRSPVKKRRRDEDDEEKRERYRREDRQREEDERKRKERERRRAEEERERGSSRRRLDERKRNDEEKRMEEDLEKEEEVLRRRLEKIQKKKEDLRAERRRSRSRSPKEKERGSEKEKGEDRKRPHNAPIPPVAMPTMAEAERRELEMHVLSTNHWAAMQIVLREIGALMLRDRMLIREWGVSRTFAIPKEHEMWEVVEAEGIHRIDSEIQSYFQHNSTRSEDLGRKGQVLQVLYKEMTPLLEGHGVQLKTVGSSNSFLAPRNSNLDLALVPSNPSTTETTVRDIFFPALPYIINSKGGTIDLKAQFWMNFTCHVGGIPLSVKITIDKSAVYFSQYMAMLDSVDNRLSRLCLFIKHWADSTFHPRSLVSSYFLTNLLIHYLQCAVSPPVLPSLHALYPSKMTPTPTGEIANYSSSLVPPPPARSNKQSLGSLLVGFFLYYSSFPFEMEIISVRSGNSIPKASIIPMEAIPMIAVENPYDGTISPSTNDPMDSGRLRSVMAAAAQSLITQFRIPAQREL